MKVGRHPDPVKVLEERLAREMRFNTSLSEKVRFAESRAHAHLVKWKEEETRRLIAEADLRKVRADIARLRSENRDLRNLTLEHKALLEELESTRADLRSEREKTRRLSTSLNRRTGAEGMFGSSTSSALNPLKPNSAKSDREKRGGAKAGHAGHGRKSFSADVAEEKRMIEEKPPACVCGSKEWVPGGLREHCVIERIPERRSRRFYLKREHACPGCGRTATAKTPGVIPGGLYGNTLVSHSLTEHYFHGLTAGSVSRREGVTKGTFFQMAERCADLLAPTFEKIVSMLRHAAVLHADETGWRNDGARAFGWLFANHEISVFLFRGTRGGVVPREVLGEEPLDLNLITDRYAGYNCLKVHRQYCYTHLLRELKDLETEFPDEPEVLAFTAEMKNLLRKAIKMHRGTTDLAEYADEAGSIRNEIVAGCGREANHPGIQKFQNIFREHPERLFQWVKSPEIPAENNFAERGLRPIVIARKTSFGSQSAKGMRRREILMTFLHTAKIRGLDPGGTLKEALDVLSLDPKADILPLLGLQKEEQSVTSAA